VKDDFFLEAWSYFPFETGVGVPVPILDTCYEGRYVDPLTEGDASLRDVLERGRIRIGVSLNLAGRPLLYSTKGGADETDLSAGELDGYEIACAREATRRLGELYGVGIEPVFVPVEGDEFFPSLREAQLSGSTDVIWSGVTVRPDREALVDFVCTTFQTDTVIGAAPGVELENFPPDGPPVNVTCIAVYCDIDVPAPFVKVEYVGDVSEALHLLAEPGNGYDYHLRTIEQLATFFEENCGDCAYAQIPPVASNYWAPFTAYVTAATGGNGSSSSVNNGGAGGGTATSSAPEFLSPDDGYYYVLTSTLFVVLLGAALY